jgi:hypothetical protein
MRDKVESTAKIKINGISLTLEADLWGNETKISYQIVMVDLDFVKSC